MRRGACQNELVQVERIRDIIQRNIDALRRDLGVERLEVFGSVARGEASSDSDVDVLVTFEGPYTYRQYLDVADLLERLLGRKVDVVTSNALRERVRSQVEREAVRVA